MTCPILVGSGRRARAHAAGRSGFGRCPLTATKTRRSTRRLALPEECRTVLRARRAQQRADRLAAGEKWTASGLVFTTRNGTPIEPRNLNRAFKPLSNRTGIRQVRFHDLRRTCASLLHEQGADARTIMEVLGHSSIRVTMLPSTQKPEALAVTRQGLWSAVHSAGFEPATF
ncbi:site-specific integrase [Streptomyces sp. NPDC032198]|uniref:tyrosine-type recombinase/integrase n=1 Tax=Streptomyces sp. NPDC032198 TaxID=3155127 RepID=UPI0033F7C960